MATGDSSASGGRARQQVPKNARPSEKLNSKVIDPFKDSKNASVFASAYSSGSIPCRLVHGSVKHKLQWNPLRDEVPFATVLVLLAEGIRETVHPYSFVARTGFKELLEVVDANEQTVPLVPKLVPPIRTALNNSDESVFSAGLQALVQLSAVVGPVLNVHLKVLLPSVAKRMVGKKHRDDIITALTELEQNGGKECVAIIKSKIPTYSSSFV